MFTVLVIVANLKGRLNEMQPEIPRPLIPLIIFIQEFRLYTNNFNGVLCLLDTYFFFLLSLWWQKNKSNSLGNELSCFLLHLFWATWRFNSVRYISKSFDHKCSYNHYYRILIEHKQFNCNMNWMLTSHCQNSQNVSSWTFKIIVLSGRSRVLRFD